MYTKFLLTILTVLSFMAVAYCKFAEPQTIEPFAGLQYPSFGIIKQPTLSNGITCTDRYQWSDKTSPVDATLVVAPSSGGAPSANNSNPYSYVVDAVNPLFDDIEPSVGGGSDPHPPMDGGSEMKREGFESTNGLNNPGCMQEGYTGPDNFYTVPGTFQSELSPRFMNEGFGANITYNFPDEKYLAAEVDNPLSLANNVESYEPQQQDNYENVKTTFAQVHEPVPLPRTMDGREGYNADDVDQEINTGRMSGDSRSSEVAPAPGNPGADTQFKMYDRMMITTGQRTGNTNQCDMIRGDLPILPNPQACGWFQSRYASPQYLCTGALAVLAGADNPTTAAMTALQVEYTGLSTIGGAPVTATEELKSKGNLAATAASIDGRVQAHSPNTPGGVSAEFVAFS